MVLAWHERMLPRSRVKDVTCGMYFAMWPRWCNGDEQACQRHVWCDNCERINESGRSSRMCGRQAGSRSLRKCLLRLLVVSVSWRGGGGCLGSEVNTAIQRSGAGEDSQLSFCAWSQFQDQVSVLWYIFTCAVIMYTPYVHT